MIQSDRRLAPARSPMSPITRPTPSVCSANGLDRARPAARGRGRLRPLCPGDKANAKAAVELLDWARLLSPGGLVEEAALRREIALLAGAKDVARVAMLTRQYVTRFAASLYAADFLPISRALCAPRSR